MFPGLSYNKANNTFLNSIRKNEVKAQVEFTLKLWKGLGSSVIDVTVTRDSLLLYVLNFISEFWRVGCGSVVVRERD